MRIHQWIEERVGLVEKALALLVKAVEWCLTICCVAMALVAMARLVLPMAIFRSNPLPEAVLYFTVLITMFTAFYSALALLAIAGYHRYRHLPVWTAVRHGTRLLIAALMLFVILVLTHAPWRA